MNEKLKFKNIPHPSFYPHHFAPLAVLTLLLWLPSGASFAGPSNDTASATNTATTKTETHLTVPPPFVEPPVPEALFVMPKGPADGKDPFFPKSSLPYGEVATTTTKKGPVPIVAELVLRGISGSDEKPLAIINTTTFGTDDELDVTTKAGKLRIRCLEINKAEGTALVQLGGEKRLLRLPPPAPLPPPK